MARPDRMIASVCALLLSLALVCAPALAQDGSSGSLKCKPVAFVLGRWVQFTSRSGDTAYVVMNQQPTVTNHNLALVFGMEQSAATAGDTSTTMTTLEFKDGSDSAVTFGKAKTGRYMSPNNPADEALLRDLPTYFAPLRFDIAVPWKIDTRRFTFVFRHANCPEQRIVYKYNPRGPLQPIIPDDVPVGEEEKPTDPSKPPTNPSQQQHCQLTAVTPSSQWACTPAFARDVYDYNCTAPSHAFLDSVTVQSTTNFLAMKLTADADLADSSVTRGLVSGVDSSSFPLLPGRNIIVIGTEWGGVCAASYVFEVTRAEAPVTDGDGDAPAQAAANWRVDDFGACTGDCPNDGTQTRGVACVTEAGENVDESRCTAIAPKPTTTQTCDLTCTAPDGTEEPAPDGSDGTSAAPAASALSPLAMLAMLGVAAFATLALNL